MVSKERLEKLIEDCCENNTYAFGSGPGTQSVRIKYYFSSQKVIQVWSCPYLNWQMIQEGLNCDYAESILNTKYYQCNAKK